MTALDKPTFQRLMTRAAIVTQRELSDELMETYWSFVRDMNRQEFMDAMANHLRTSPYFPKISELCRAPSEDETFEHEANDAWQKVIRGIGLHGRYASVDFGPDANAAVNGLGGWVHLCSLDADQLGYAANSFRRSFKLTRRNGVPTGMGDYLHGLAERANGSGSEEVFRLLPGDAVRPELLDEPELPSIEAPRDERPLDPTKVARLIEDLTEKRRLRQESRDLIDDVMGGKDA